MNRIPNHIFENWHFVGHRYVPNTQWGSIWDYLEQVPDAKRALTEYRINTNYENGMTITYDYDIYGNTHERFAINWNRLSKRQDIIDWIRTNYGSHFIEWMQTSEKTTVLSHFPARFIFVDYNYTAIRDAYHRELRDELLRVMCAPAV